MATLVKQGSRFYLQFYDGKRQPKRKKVALRAKRRKPAQTKRRELETAYVEGRFDPWKDDPFNYDQPQVEHLRLSVALERFVEEKKRQNRSPNTIRTYEGIISRFARLIGKDLKISQIKSSHLADFLYQRSVSASTQRKRYRHVKALFRWCLQEGYTDANPLEALTPPETPHKLPKHVTRVQLRAICSAVVREYERGLEKVNGKGGLREGFVIWLVPLFRFAFYTGMRAGELARLKWGDIDFDSSLIYIREQKNRREQTIPLSSKAREVIADVERGEDHHLVFRSPSSRPAERSVRSWVSNISSQFRKYKKEAGITRSISFHGLRHGYCTYLAEQGVSASAIKALARHQDFSTTQRYIHLANEHLKRELDDVF